MINFLAICGAGSKIQPLWNIVGYVVNFVMIGVPILLIVFGMVDLGRAVIASKEDEVKKATKLLGKRFLYAVGVFAMVWFVTFVFDRLGAVITSENTENKEDFEYDEDTWRDCWSCNIRKGGKNCK